MTENKWLKCCNRVPLIEKLYCPDFRQFHGSKGARFLQLGSVFGGTASLRVMYCSLMLNPKWQRMHIRQLVTALWNLVSQGTERSTPIRGLRPANLEGRIFVDQCVPFFSSLLSPAVLISPLFPIPTAAALCTAPHTRRRRRMSETKKYC